MMLLPTFKAHFIATLVAGGFVFAATTWSDHRVFTVWLWTPFKLAVFTDFDVHDGLFEGAHDVS